MFVCPSTQLHPHQPTAEQLIKFILFHKDLILSRYRSKIFVRNDQLYIVYDYKLYNSILWLESIAGIILAESSPGLVCCHRHDNDTYQNQDDSQADQHRGHDVETAGSGAVLLRPLQVAQHLAVSGL